MMSKEISDSLLEITKGDITEQSTEAIVNAANKRLAPGGGVAGAVHRAAGPSLWKECKKLDRCETGSAKITSGHNLKAEYIIHTVGPVYSGDEEDEKDLRSSYRSSLELAKEEGIESISFPAISTGAFGYPLEEAGKIAIDEIIQFMDENDVPDKIRMVLHTRSDYKTHKKILERYFD